jgi:hypothetical protein
LILVQVQAGPWLDQSFCPSEEQAGTLDSRWPDVDGGSAADSAEHGETLRTRSPGAEAAERGDTFLLVSGASSRTLEELRLELLLAVGIEDAAERALEIVGIIEAAAAPLGIRPVIVGGMAVYFWTANDAFLTGDIDVIMETPPSLSLLLGDLGFDRSADGRHWELPDTDVLLEAPATSLDNGAVVTRVSLASGRVAGVISRIDILMDRLDEFQATGHRDAAQQALVLLSQLGAEESDELERRAEARRLGSILRAVAPIVARLLDGGTFPESDELHTLARDALRAEYSSREP